MTCMPRLMNREILLVPKDYEERIAGILITEPLLNSICMHTSQLELFIYIYLTHITLTMFVIAL
jgi:hypothetical protein